MTNTLTFTCNNCHNTVSEKIDHETALYVKYQGTAGLCCNSCCKMANAFYSRPEYKNFELAENG